MKYIIILIFILFATVFACCNSGEENSRKNVQKNNDSLTQRGKAIEIYKFDLSAVEDSVAKYGIHAQVDTCLKIIYTIYCQYKFRDRLWCATNDKTLGESRIAPVSFDTDSESKIQIGFKVFFNDSIPCSQSFADTLEPFVSAFEIEGGTKRIANGISGEHTKISIDNLRMIYDSIHSSIQLHEYLKRYGTGLHPNYKRLL